MPDPPPEAAPLPTGADEPDASPSPEVLAATRRLERSGWKLCVIAGGSALIPLLGLPFALFALVAGLSTRSRARALGLERTARQAGWSLALALLSCAWQATLIATWWGGRPV